MPGILGASQGGIQFAVYEEMKRWRQQAHASRDDERGETLDAAMSQLTNMEYILMSSMSKLVASLATYPYQVVRSRLQDIRGDSAGLPYRGTLDVVRRIIKQVDVCSLVRV